MRSFDWNVSQSQLAVRDYDRLIMLAYIAFAIFALALLYISSNGAGFSDAELSVAAALP